MIDSWIASGQTKKDFCESQGIAKATFQYWHRKYRLDNEANNEKDGFVPIKIAPASSGSPVVELVFPDGKRVNFYQHVDASLLRSLLSS